MSHVQFCWVSNQANLEFCPRSQQERPRLGLNNMVSIKTSIALMNAHLCLLDTWQYIVSVQCIEGSAREAKEAGKGFFPCERGKLLP